ncbi:MAG: hypothetical protein M3R15_23460 [Acidobacteriota bacterium]|nr:hypothetical protein [Acidobacteriota bacterium]
MSRKVNVIRGRGLEPRVENPLKYEIELAKWVVRTLCRFEFTPEERDALITALQALAEVTGVRLDTFMDKQQGVYVASAKANEMRRRGDRRGVEARQKVRDVIYSYLGWRH